MPFLSVLRVPTSDFLYHVILLLRYILQFVVFPTLDYEIRLKLKAILVLFILIFSFPTAMAGTYI